MEELEIFDRPVAIGTSDLVAHNVAGIPDASHFDCIRNMVPPSACTAAGRWMMRLRMQADGGGDGGQFNNGERIGSLISTANFRVHLGKCMLNLTVGAQARDAHWMFLEKCLKFLSSSNQNSPGSPTAEKGEGIEHSNLL